MGRRFPTQARWAVFPLSFSKTQTLLDQLLGVVPGVNYIGGRHYKDGTVDWPALQRRSRPICQAFEATLQQVVELGAQRIERTTWASSVRTSR